MVIPDLQMCSVSRSDFVARFGVHLGSVFGSRPARLFEEGIAGADDGDTIVLTRHGRIHSTNVYERFHTDDDLAPRPETARSGSAYPNSCTELVH